jgi:tryptophan synthase beta chain
MLRMDTIQYNLPQSRIPQAWYNIAADLPKPMAPPLHPGTLKPLGPDDLAPLFPMSLIMQEVSTEREIEIPGEVRQVYAQWRPSPLFRARRLEQALDTPAHIYYKNEGVSPAGSHKPNTAVPQAFYNKQAGTKRLSTETGAGQWGSALAMACAFFGMECKVYMVRVSYDQKPYRRALMEVFGASVTASPSSETQTGRAILAARSASPSPRRSRSQPQTRTPSTRSAASSTTSCCIRPSSASRPSSRWRWPAMSPMSSSPARAADRTSPD